MLFNFKDELAERLMRYASIDSQSDEESFITPSSVIQYDMLNLLEKELKEFNLADIKITEYGTLIATVPGKIKGEAICFLAHVDTAPQFNATNVKPRMIKNYDGSDIKFPDNDNLILSPNEFSYLGEKIGHDIITASGKTLLGADDKAGIAIIMTAVNFIVSNLDQNHSEIRIAFTTDEEIGRGVHKDLPKDLNVKFAYTFDGGKVGEIDNETFSADSAEVIIKGVSIHPGEAKNEMVNATHLASEIINNLPLKTMTPEVTEKREGFIHATEMIGNSSEMKIKFIIRDFEINGLENKKEILKDICKKIQNLEPRAKISISFKRQYRNMRYWLDENKTPLEIAEKALINKNIKPIKKPIRGGTDGSLLTENGVPTPNIFTGMQNVHGPLEWISSTDMSLATEVMIEIIKLNSNLKAEK